MHTNFLLQNVLHFDDYSNMVTISSRLNLFGILSTNNINYGQKWPTNLCNLIFGSSLLQKAECRLEQLYLLENCRIFVGSIFEFLNICLLGISIFSMGEMRNAYKISTLKIRRGDNCL